MKTIYFILCFFYISFCKSQDIQFCNTASDITIDLTGNIVPYTTNSYFTIDNYNHFIFFYPDQSKTSSFWYSIKILKNTELSIIIKPIGENDIYNFFVYQDPQEGNFCDQVYTKKLIPIRTNLLKDSMARSGTGLLKDAYENIENNNVDYLYHTAFHKPIEAKKGDIYYINVYHTEGDDCGHTLEIGTEDNVQKFKSIHQSCFTDSIKKIPSFIPIIDPQLANLITPKEKKFKNTLILKGQVIDSITQKSLFAEIKNYNKSTNIKDTATNKTGEFLVLLEGSIFYEIEFSSIGYKPKKIKFLKHTLQNELRDIDKIELCPLKSGDHFILKDIHFYAGTYAIKDESVPVLDLLLNYMQNHPNEKIEIQGHTNGKGKIKKKIDSEHKGPEWNFSGNEKKLSKMRAISIKEYLVKNGIDENRIQTIGYGDTKMLYPKPKNKEERDLNKRVEIVLL